MFLVISAHAQLLRLPAGYCEHMKVRANLHIVFSTSVRGTVIDGSGEALRDTSIEVRRFQSGQKQIPIAKLSTDSAGRFEIANVQKGDYRFVVLTRLFQQPKNLRCEGDRRCVLKIRLDTMPTDMPESQCPIK